MRCPKCGAENPDYAVYCGKCAAELRKAANTSGNVRKCPVCGSESPEGGQYCSRCGAIIAEPIRLDDPRLVGAEDDLKKAIRFRRPTDVIIEPLLAFIPLVLSIVGAIVGIVAMVIQFQSISQNTNLTSADIFSRMRGSFVVIALFSAASVAILAFITYGLVKRRNDHSVREHDLMIALVRLVKSAAWTPERYYNVNHELRIMELESGQLPYRSPLVWSLVVALGAVSAIGLLPIIMASDTEAWMGVFLLTIGLSALVGFVSYVLMIYMFYWLGKDFKQHDTRLDMMISNGRSALWKLGFPPPATYDYGHAGLPDRSFVVYLIVTVFFSPFVYYWWYTLIKDPNEHFRAQWKFEDELLATIGDQRHPLPRPGPSVSTL